MTWYKDWFRDANYSTVYEHRDEIEAEAAIDLIERMVGRNPVRRVLDVGCGSGRHSIAFARRGYGDVTGIDLSPTLLEEASDHARELDLSIEFLQRDMRDIPDRVFDLAINLFTSFGYFETDAENAEVIRNVASHLAPTGWFVIDFLNAEWVRRQLVSHDERALPNGMHIQQTRWIEDGRIEKRLLIRNATEAKEYIESVRLFTLEDFERMFADAGLALRHTFGNYRGEPLQREVSQRLLMFAQR